MHAGAAAFTPDYRLAPEHPFPAATEDVRACYAGLVELDYKKVAVTGDSAGGTLAMGSAAGLALGMLATRILAFVVYGARPWDPLVLAGVVAAMAMLGLVATWIPAQRALSVDPLTLLREE